MPPSACSAADYDRKKSRQISMENGVVHPCWGGLCACWWSALCRDKGGLVPWGDSGQSAAQRRRGIQGQCGVQSCEC